MARERFSRCSKEVDAAVDRWLREIPHSINDLIGYQITRGIDGLPVIELKMYFVEPETPAEKQED
jgi:hypothetical protein